MAVLIPKGYPAVSGHVPLSPMAILSEAVVLYSWITSLNHSAFTRAVSLPSAIQTVLRQSRFRTDVRAHEGQD